MPVLTRFTVDLVTDEPLSETRVDTLSRELTDHLHVLGIEPEDEGHPELNSKLAYGHVHDTAEGDKCAYCRNNSVDYLNGDVVLANG
jgi:hypothetical protein